MKVLETSFNKDELEIINSVLKNGDIGFGTNVNEFENTFKYFSNKEFNIAVNSASSAAFMIFAYLKEKYGVCDVYTPSLAFTSPAWAAKHFGHNLVWVDLNDDLLFDCDNYLEKSKLPEWKYPIGRKKVVMPILYGGVSTINNWKLNGDEIIVIDSAHCITPTIKSDFIFFSFHPTKPICTSDGGMISTDIEEANEYFRNYRNFGRKTNSDGYDITQEGFKFYMNNLNATIGLVSLSNYYKNLEIRKNNFNLIQNKFEGRIISHDLNSSFYFASLITDKAEEINKQYNLAKHYPLLHKTKYYTSQSLIGAIPLLRTEQLHLKIVNLPLYDINIYNS